MKNRTRKQPSEPQISGVIQLGETEVVIEKRDDHGVHYRVEALVLDYWGSRAKPGARHVRQRGIAPVEETDEQLVERCLMTYGNGYSIVGYQGPVSGFPYTAGE